MKEFVFNKLAIKLITNEAKKSKLLKSESSQMKLVKNWN